MGLFAERAKKKEEELNKALGKKMVYADDKSTSSLNNATTKTVVPTINKPEAVKSASDNLSGLERASRIGNIDTYDENDILKNRIKEIERYKADNDVALSYDASNERLKRQSAIYQSEIDKLQQDIYGNKVYDNTFVDRFGANYTQGRLSQDSNKAWSEYIENPTPENYAHAQSIDRMLEQFALNNNEVLSEDGWISKSLAGYLPQSIDQTKAKIGGALIGGLGGSVIPFVGTGLGIKAGMVAASGKESYDNMRGSAYKSLIEAGVDNQTALAASQDEAVISSIIEMADTGIDIATFGIGKLIGNVGKMGLQQTAKAIASEGAEVATKKSLKKLLSALGKYGLNVGQEALEEASQEVISIANLRRALEGETGWTNLVGNTVDTAFNLGTEDAQQVKQSAIEGARIAAMLGGATMLSTGMANTAIEARNNKIYTEVGQKIVENNIVEEVIQTGLESAPDTESHKLAQQLQSKIEAGGTVDEVEIGELYIENAKAIEEEEKASFKASYLGDIEDGLVDDKLTAETSEVAEIGSQEATQPINNVVLTNEDKMRNEAQRRANEIGFENAIRTLGDNGAKALGSTYKLTDNFDKFYKDFSTYYEAGSIGTPMDLIDSNYNKKVDAQLKLSAYMAGQKDAEVSFERDKANAKVYANGEFISGTAPKNVSSDTLAVFNSLAKATGNRIRFADKVYNGKANGQYLNGEITIAKDAEKPFYVVAKHEVTHGLQVTSPVEYRTYRNYAVELAEKTNGRSITVVEQYKLRANNAGINLTTEQAMDEIAADFTEKILKDGKTLEQFIEENIVNSKSMLQKFFDAVHDFIKKVKAAFNGNRASINKAAIKEFGLTISELEKAEKMWLNAMKATYESSKNAQQNKSSEVAENVGNTHRQFSLKDSNGNQLTEEQAEFFKDSKVRDENGNLLVMYHGTADGGGFTVFEGNKLNNNSITSQIGQGFYFTNSKDAAQMYTKNIDTLTGRASRGKNPHIHEVYLNIKNPFNVKTNTLNLEDAKAVFLDGKYEWFFDSWISTALNNQTVNGVKYTKSDVQRMSKEERVSLYVDYLYNSYDGTKSVLQNMVRAFRSDKQEELLQSMKKHLGYDGIVEEFKAGQYQYVVFDSNQIKNTDNLNPTDDDDIRYSLKGAEEQTHTTSNLISDTDTEGTAVISKKDGTPVAMIQADGNAQFSLKTYADNGRNELTTWLNKRVKSKQIDRQQADDIVRQMDEFYEVCSEYADKYTAFGKWSNAGVITDDKGKPVFSVMIPNGEYKINFDFSPVCKKRRTLDAVFSEMIRRGLIDKLVLGEGEIAKINDIIRTYGFETACALCFVDSKRYRQAKVADSFVEKYNNTVNMLLPKDSNVKAHHFDFVDTGNFNDTGVGLHTLKNSEISDGIAKLKRYMKGLEPKTVPYKIAKHLLEHPEDRRLVNRSEFMNTDGFSEVRIKNPALLSLYNSSKGSGGPKASFPDVQYLGEILKKNHITPKKAYEVGGVRLQSFSDYIARLVFDYLQLFADLSAKALPVQVYSKEELFVLQFGMTGAKINMSLVPAVVDGGKAAGLDAEGNYVWYDGQSFGSDVNVAGSAQKGFERAVEIQSAEGYSKNCGIIAVGISDEHILKMLGDNNIRMVIPYHKSSLNSVVAKMTNIDSYKDYTSVQNTRYVQTGSKIEEKDFNFNASLRKHGDAKTAANEYLEWCKKKNFIPKFNEFAWHENYYKLLVDFTTYDNNGNASPQGAVTMTFPTKNNAFGSMAELIEQGLSEEDVLEGRRKEKVPEIVDEIEKTFERRQFSLKDSNGNQLTEAQAEFFKDSKVRDKNGNLKVVYHGTPEGGFTVFDSSKSHFTTKPSPAFFFSDNEDLPNKYYTEGKNKQVYSVYLNITNPLIINANGAGWNDVPLADAMKGADEFKYYHYLRHEWAYTETSTTDKIAKWAKRNGYDGVMSESVRDGSIHEDPSTVYAVFDSNQIKNTDNLNPTDDPDIRFQLKEPVEETKNLIAVHNVYEDKLKEALKIGGFPMPSIAIVKADSGHSKYGGISFIFSKDTIDPQKDIRNYVYGGDAYTPTAPIVEYPVNYDVLREVEKKIAQLSKSVADGIFANDSAIRRTGIEDTSDESIEEIAKKLAADDSVRAAFVAAQGSQIEPVYKIKQFDGYGNDALSAYLDKVGAQEVARLMVKFELGERLSAEELETAKDSIMEHWIKSVKVI